MSLAVAAVASAAGATSLEGSDPSALPGPVVVEVDDPLINGDDPAIVALGEAEQASLAGAERVSALELSPPNGFAYATSGIRVNYVVGSDSTLPPADVRLVVETAAALWSDLLVIEGPLVIDFAWKPLAPGMLGIGGPTTVHRADLGYTGNDDLSGSAWYPAALANTIHRSDQNGEKSEISITLDSARYGSKWFVSTTPGATPPSGTRDLLSTMVHEIGHGLGFLGSPRSSTSTSSGSFVGQNPLVYDFLVEYNEQRLLNLENPDRFLGTGQLRIDLGNGRDLDIYDPSTFVYGSSFSHFDEKYQIGEPGALMTPVLGGGELTRFVDGATLAVLEGIGWDLNVNVATPRVTGTIGKNRALVVNWEADFATASALPPTAYEVVLTQAGTRVESKTVPGTTTNTTFNGLTNFVDYEVTVTAQRTTPDGVLTLTGPPSVLLGRPGHLSISGANSSRTLQWTLPTGPGSDGAAFRVSRRAIGSTRWVDLTTTSGSRFTDSAIPNGNYQYRLVMTSNGSTSPGRRSTVIGVSSGAVRAMALDGQIARLYEAALTREPEQSGMQFWLGQRSQGMTLEDIASAFVASNEFVRKYGALGDLQFVQQVYRNVLGRPPEQQGLDFWVGRLQSGLSRGGLMIGFSDSPEYVTRTGTSPVQSAEHGRVFRLYFAYFLREPDAAGNAFWVEQLQQGRTLTSISEAMAGSPEFTATYGPLSDAQFVELAYQNVLGRSPDAPGLASWLASLQSGRSRGSVMLGIASSPEFILRTGTTP